MRRLVAVAILTAVFLIGIVAGLALKKIVPVAKPHGLHSGVLESAGFVALEVTVYDKEGKIKHHIFKFGDPPTVWSIVYWLYSMWDNNIASDEYCPNRTIKDYFGRTITIIPDDDTTHGVLWCYIVVGNGTTPASPLDYTVEKPIMNFTPTEYYYGYNSTHAWFYVSGSIAINETMVFREVALVCDIVQNNTKLLMFRDVLPSYITVNAGDVLRVTWWIYASPYAS